MYGWEFKNFKTFLDSFLKNNLYLFTLVNSKNKHEIFSKSNLDKNRNVKIQFISSNLTSSCAELFIIVFSLYYEVEVYGENSYGKSTVLGYKNFQLIR